MKVKKYSKTVAVIAIISAVFLYGWPDGEIEAEYKEESLEKSDGTTSHNTDINFKFSLKK